MAVHPSRDTLTYWENGRGPAFIRLVEYFQKGELVKGVDYRQHVDHATLDDEFLSRGGLAELASRPRDLPRQQQWRESDDVATDHIIVAGDEDNRRQLTHRRN
jgi:hypothetical protein